MPKLFRAAHQVLSEDGAESWAPAAVDRITGSVPIECLDVSGMDWIEIDFPEDVRKAQKEVWPAIAARER